MEVNTNTQNCCKLTRKSFNIKSNKKGLVLKIHNTKIIDNKPQCIRLTQASFSNSGQHLALTTHTNEVFIFDFILKKCWSLGFLEAGFIKFSPTNDSQIFICDLKIFIYNFQNGDFIQHLEGHKFKIKYVEFLKRFCVTCSEYEAIIWDLNRLKKIKVLTVENDNLFKFIAFVPIKNVFCACFGDYNLQIWDESTFGPIVQIFLQELKNIPIIDFAFTSDGKIMIIAGLPCNLYIFTTNQWKFFKTIKLPLIHNIRSIRFLSQPFDGGSNTILVILSSNGALHFFNLYEEKIINLIQEEMEIKKFATSNEGIYISAVMSSGMVYIYNYLDIINTEKIASKVSCYNISNKKGNGKMAKKKILSNKIKNVLTEKQIKAILTQYGEYPELYRRTIWSTLLQCPNDEQQFDALLKTEYEMFFDLENRFPLQNKLDLKNMKQYLSLIVSWSSFFNSIDYLPILIYPFVHYLHNNPVQCFEIISMVILNYCQFWFEYHPLPPLNILGIIENVLAEFDSNLLKHLNSNEIPSKTYAWPILQSAFSEVLGTNDWLILWDHIITNEPAFFLLSVVAFILINKHKILKCDHYDKFIEIFTMQNAFNFKAFIKKIYVLLHKTSEKNHPRRYITSQRKGSNLKFEDFSKFTKTQTKKMDEIKLIYDGKNGDSEISKKSEEFIRLSLVEKTYKDKLKEENNNKVKKPNYKTISIQNVVLDEAFERFKTIEISRKSTEALISNVEKDLAEKYSALKNCTKKSLRSNYASRVEEIKKVQKIRKNAVKIKKIQQESSLAAIDAVIEEIESVLIK